jgi:hypothetical protein
METEETEVIAKFDAAVDEFLHLSRALVPPSSGESADTLLAAMSAVIEPKLPSASDFNDIVCTYLDSACTRLRLVISSLDTVKEFISHHSPQDIQRLRPRTLLSVNALRAVYTTIELLWSLGVGIFIESEVGCEVTHEAYPKSLLLQSRTVDNMRLKLRRPMTSTSVASCVDVMFSTVTHSSFIGLMLDRNMLRLFLSMLVLDRHEDRTRLRDFASDGNRNTLLVHETKALLFTCNSKYRSKLRAFHINTILAQDGIERLLRG